MSCACVDIGSNTTRLLLAEFRDGSLRELMTQRVFTRLGKSIRRDGAIPAEKLEETAGVVERQVRHARELGAERIAIVATAAVRQARNGSELTGAIEAATGLPTRVLSEEDEARLAFLGQYTRFANMARARAGSRSNQSKEGEAFSRAAAARLKGSPSIQICLTDIVYYDIVTTCQCETTSRWRAHWCRTRACC